MSEWKKVKIKDIASLDNGINFSKSAYAPGVKIIGVSDFKDRFSPDFSTLQEVKEEIVKRGDYLQFGDILFVRSNGNRDLVGRCMLIDKNIKSTFSGFCIRLRINDLNSYNSYFFTYHFKTSLFRTSIAGSAIGANIQNLSQNRLGNYELKLPEYFTQCRIAVILSRYDSLIENYQKQIKLLEESAQRLYKEWFVDLRFPGHENTKIVDGVPEGWEKTCLKEVSHILTGKKDANFGDVGGEYLFFTCAKEPIRASSYSFDCDAVILAGNGDFNVKLYRGKFEAYQRTYVFSPFNSINLFLLFYSVNSSMQQLFMGASGSTIKFLTKQMLEQISILLPSSKIATQFYEVCDRNQKKVEILKRQIDILTEARDRLLPKLMNGEIEV